MPMTSVIRPLLISAMGLGIALAAYHLAGLAGAIGVAVLAAAALLACRKQAPVPAPAPEQVATQKDYLDVVLPPAPAGRDNAGRLLPRAREGAPSVHLHHIAYSEETRTQVPAGARLLVNRSGRADWREYGAIRQFLLHERLNDEDYYGFFSPKFKYKTGLDYADVEAFIQASREDADVYLFSQGPEYSAFFLNSFLQYDFMEPGFLACCQAFLDHIGLDADLHHLVMDSRQVVFSNYFVARPAFWRAWLDINEKLHALCEGPGGELQQALTFRTQYTDAMERKVFIVERIASLMLATDGRWRARAYDPFQLGWSFTPMRDFPRDAVLADALKIALREQGFLDYRRLYERVRHDAISAYEKSQAPFRGEDGAGGAR